MNMKSRTIYKMCEALKAGDSDMAASIARSEYPFMTHAFAGRKYTELESTRIFIRDGFIDRYSGNQLIFPGVLRLLSHLLPEEFPFHPHWKMSQCHIAYWELSATIDHVIPVARGGTDDETNWVTASMLRNSTKSNWTLEELGWSLLLPGNYGDWNGLTEWFLEYVNENPSHLKEKHIKRWYNAAVRAVNAV